MEFLNPISCPEQETLRNLYNAGEKQGRWKSVADCARQAGIKERTLRFHLNDGNNVNSIMESCKKVRALTPEAEAHPPRAPADNANDLSDGLAPSEWLDGLVSGELAFADQKAPDGVRFVISAKTVRQLQLNLKEEELDDTEDLLDLLNLLLEELTRRVSLLLQEPEGTGRRVKWQKLTRSIDAFYASVRALDKVSPIASARLVDEIEAQTKRIRNLIGESLK